MKNGEIEIYIDRPGGSQPYSIKRWKYLAIYTAMTGKQYWSLEISKPMRKKL